MLLTFYYSDIPLLTMKILSVIPIHSFVDIITNSSSELFICETKKSVDAVKETLVALANLYNQKFGHQSF